ncbi:O-antigen ligase family protein [Candidatus Poribacteria bacterium]
MRKHSLAAGRSAESVIGITILAILLGVGLIWSDPSNRALIMVGAGTFLFLFFVKPETFLLAYLIISPIVDQLMPFFTRWSGSGARFGPHILLRGGLIIFMVFYLVTDYLAPNVSNKRGVKAAWPMLILILLLGINTVLNRVTFILGANQLAKFTFWILMLLTVENMVVQGKMKLETIYRYIIFSVILSLISVLISDRFFVQAGLDVRDSSGLAGTESYRVGGLFGETSLVLSLALGFTVIVASTIRQRSFLAVALLSLLGGIVVISIIRTYTRTGYTAFLGGFLTLNAMVWIYAKRPGMRRARLILGWVFIMVTIVITVYAYMYTEPLAKRFEDLSDTQTMGSGRLILYGLALNTYSNYDVFEKIMGVGLGRAGHFGSHAEGIYFSTHAEYFLILLSGGLIGLGLYLWIFVSLWRQLKSTVRHDYWPFIIACSSIATCLVAMVTTQISEYPPVMTLFSFLVGGAIGYYGRATEDRTGESDTNRKSELDESIVEERSVSPMLGRNL